MDWESTKNLLAVASPFLLLGLAGIGTLYKMERDKRRDIENQLNNNKQKIYSEFIHNYSSLFFKENGKEKTHDDYVKIALDTQAFSRQALLYASDDVLKKFYEMYRLQLNQPTDADTMTLVRQNIRAFAGVVKAIRKELGHSQTRIHTDMIGGLLITDYTPD